MEQNTLGTLRSYIWSIFISPLPLGMLAHSLFVYLNFIKVRQGLKKFSNWPTYPQLYAKGELIGGLDIVRVI